MSSKVIQVIFFHLAFFFKRGKPTNISFTCERKTEFKKYSSSFQMKYFSCQSTDIIIIIIIILIAQLVHLKLRGTVSIFGGLEVACWPLEPKFTGFKPGRSRRIFSGRKKNPQHALLRKAVGPMS
jgi:hypothetical protein